LTRRTGRSHSVRPVSKRSPSWLSYSPEEVEAIIIKLAREGNPPSMIGVLLRDHYGIPLAKPILGTSILKVLEKAGMKPDLPEDISNLIAKATRIRRHLARNRSDTDNISTLEIVESRIRRLSKYYRKHGILPAEWKYSPE